jgi:hypothetical protein
MGNWWDTPQYAARKAGAGKGVVRKPNNSSANAVEHAMGYGNKSQPQDNGGYLSSNSAMPDGVGTPDYAALARAIYEPSLDYLDSQSSQAKSRNRNNDAALRDMYGGLVKSIRGDASNISNNYNGSIGEVANGTRQAVGAVDNTYDQSANEMMAMLKHLGIEAAAPDTLRQNTRDEAFFKNMISTQGKSVADMLRSQRAGALEYNTAQSNISRQSGVDARAQNKLSLEDTLNQIMGRKADLETQINGQAASMQQSATDSMLKQMQAQQDDQMKQARLALDTAKFQASQTQANQPKPMNDPWTKLAQMAGTLYPNQEASGNALAAVRDTVTAASRNGQNFASPNDFINAVLARNPRANDSAQLTQLASYLFQQLYG